MKQYDVYSLKITHNTLRKTGFVKYDNERYILIFKKAKNNWFDLFAYQDDEHFICYTRGEELKFNNIPDLITYIEGVKFMLKIFYSYFYKLAFSRKGLSKTKNRYIY